MSRLELPTLWVPRGNRFLWGALLAALIVLPNLFAIQQYRATGGYLFYSNAFDEPTYLSYDGASMMQSAARLSESLVVALHHAGLSGGQVNLLFDIFFPVITVVFLRRIARRLGFSPAESVVYPFVIVASPVVFGYSNPYYARLFNLNYYSQSLAWITLPQAYFPPFFRSPEPQFSLCIASIATDAALSRRSYLIALGVAPFLYPFIGIPYVFAVLSLLLFHGLDRFIASGRWRALGAITGSYLMTATAILAYYVLVVSRTDLADFLPATRWPLLSGMGMATLLLYMIIRRRLEPELRMPALCVAASPWAVANTQVVTGFLQVPHDLEQCFGVVAVGILIVLALHTLTYRAATLVASGLLSCALLGVYSSNVYAINSSMWQRIPPSAELIASLRDQPESVLIGDPDLADLYGLIAPRLHFSAMARSQAFLSTANVDVATSERFQRYLCTKHLVMDGEVSGVVPREGFGVLDRAFRYLGQDFPLIHLNRKTAFRQYFDPAADPTGCTPRPLQLFPAIETGEQIRTSDLIEGLRPGSRPPATAAALDVVTPQQQWAYAAIERVASEQDASVRLFEKLMDVRVRATLTKGCVGVGVLTPDQGSFVIEKSLSAVGQSQLVDLLFKGERRPHWLVVRNCSSEGASAATIQSVELFFATGVTVTTIPPLNRVSIH